jgi:hypothetical protein
MRTISWFSVGWGAAGSGVKIGLQLGHRRSLPDGDLRAGSPCPDDVFRVAQFDEG